MPRPGRRVHSTRRPGLGVPPVQANASADMCCADPERNTLSASGRVRPKAECRSFILRAYAVPPMRSMRRLARIANRVQYGWRPR